MLLTTVAFGCGGNGSSAPGSGSDTMTVRGMIVELESRSLTELVSITIRDENGNLVVFRSEGFVGFTPSHLREHQALGIPVTVHFKETSEGLLAVRIID